MLYPDDLKYTAEHEWVRVLESDSEKVFAVVGITDFAQSELGELVYVEVDTVGEHVQKDAIFGTVEAVKTTSDLFMPVSGHVVEFNPALNENDGDNPGLINDDPYQAGWIIKIEVDDPTELGKLMDASAYQEVIV
ncbi:MAG: glycine cleavage system protein GcvH [Saprospiraceae bacterium]|nr:glycine cleavage system protein GcvH [Saprospiraceae bacterium]